MTATKITAEEIRNLKIASLPTHPTSPRAYGGKGYTASEMKAAFDMLPLFIIERLNALLDDIDRDGDGSVSEHIKTGITDGHTLANLFKDVSGGSFATYLTVGDESLAILAARMDARLVELEGELLSLGELISQTKAACDNQSEILSSLGERIESNEERLCALEEKGGESADE